MNDIFKYFKLTEDNVLDVFQNIDFDDIIENSNGKYNIYQPNDYDNLMLISHRFYGTIDDWWILYCYNKLQDAMFGAMPKTLIAKFIEYYKNLIMNYDNLVSNDKDIIEEVVRFYYCNYYPIDEASKKSIETLTNPYERSNPTFIADFDYIITVSMIDSQHYNSLKVPYTDIVMLMKQRMKEYSKTW